MIQLLLYVVMFVLLSGLMAMVEAAVLSVTRGEIGELRLHHRRGAEALHSLTQRLTRAVGVLVLFTNTINILGPILAGTKAVQLFGDASIGALTAILTFSTIVFSEIIPKSLGMRYAPTIARLAAPTLLALMYVLFPVVVALGWLAGLFTRGTRPIGTEDQIRSLVTIGRRAGHIESQEGQLIQRAFVLNDRTAADVMTPLEKVVAIEATATVIEMAQRVFRHEYSRYPVFGASQNDVQGMALSRDALEALSDGRDQEPVSTIVRPALTVDAAMRSDELLALFRDRRVHLAVVQDDGRTVGLVTLEDVLEELVGEIEDEKD